MKQTPEMTARDRARYAKNIASGLCQCGRERLPDRVTCAPCRESHNAWHRRNKEKIVEAYGGKCTCPCGCTISNIGFLTIDHVYNDGKEHRKTTRNLYLWLLKHDCPKDGFRLMCYNCNIGRSKMASGICPACVQPAVSSIV